MTKRATQSRVSAGEVSDVSGQRVEPVIPERRRETAKHYVCKPGRRRKLKDAPLPVVCWRACHRCECVTGSIAGLPTVRHFAEATAAGVSDWASSNGRGYGCVWACAAARICSQAAYSAGVSTSGSRRTRRFKT